MRYGYPRQTRNAGANPRPGSNVNNIPLTESKSLGDVTEAPSVSPLVIVGGAVLAGFLLLRMPRR